ncbi:MAG: hypothetical protein ACOH5I_15815 [Oligoflexus sp.]
MDFFQRVDTLACLINAGLIDERRACEIFNNESEILAIKNELIKDADVLSDEEVQALYDIVKDY